MTATRPIRQSAVASIAHGEIAGLDGLRAISVLIVMTGHFGFGSFIPGGLGVTIFYFISGFLITTLMLREAHATGSVSIGRFYVRRILRLQPELWALMILSGFGAVAVHGWPTRLDWLSGLFYLTDYAHEGAFTAGEVQHMRWPALWSLAVEEHYYLTYPLLFVALMKTPRRLLMALVGLLCLSLAIRFYYFAAGTDSDIIYSASETRIDSIAYGCVGSLLLWYLPPGIGNRIRGVRACLMAVALAGLAATIVMRDPFMRDTLRYSVQGLALILLFLGFYADAAAGRFIRLLEWPALKWIGRMSYGAYLWHQEIASDLEHVLDLPPTSSSPLLAAIEVPIFCVLTFAVAWASFELFQRPVLALRHRFRADGRAAVGAGLADVPA